MPITSDWHIHSKNSCDSACMEVTELVTQAAARGIVDFGLTDHLHTPCNRPDLACSRQEYWSSGPGARFHFGVEVSCVSSWELEQIAGGRHGNPVYGLRHGGPAGGQLAIGLTAADIDQFGLEYVVGGAHWPLSFERRAIIRDYHRQNMFLATHPLVDIVAHPWWWMGHWQAADGGYPGEPWFDDFGHIPAALHDEFAAAAVEHGSVVEINLAAMLFNPSYPGRFVQQYLEYLAQLQARGVPLSIGSDCHCAHYEVDFAGAGALLASAGIRAGDLWRLPPRPQRPGAAPG
jgi:histidinol phosphatase-like PHP family hydrolase